MSSDTAIFLGQSDDDGKKWHRQNTHIHTQTNTCATATEKKWKNQILILQSFDGNVIVNIVSQTHTRRHEL